VSTLHLLVVLLLVLAGGQAVAGVAYVVHRRPALNAPVMAGLTALAVLVAVVTVVVSASGR
jgi:hypothetical protein